MRKSLLSEDKAVVRLQSSEVGVSMPPILMLVSQNLF